MSHGAAAAVQAQLGIAAWELGGLDVNPGGGEGGLGAGAGVGVEGGDCGDKAEAELEAALAAADALQSTPSFRVRTAFDSMAPLLMADVVLGADNAGVQDPRTARHRLAVSQGFAECFVPLRELLGLSLRRKTCPLLLLAA